MTSDASSRNWPTWTARTKRISIFRSSAEILKWRGRDWEEKKKKKKRGRILTACSARSSVFTLECQQVKVGDNTVWCCQTEFLPPNFTSSSPRPLSRLQSPPLLPALSLSSHFNPLQQSPSVQSAQEHPHHHPNPHSKNCNPNFFFLNPILPSPPPPPPPPPSACNYSSASALTNSGY